MKFESAAQQKQNHESQNEKAPADHQRPLCLRKTPLPPGEDAEFRANIGVLGDPPLLLADHRMEDSFPLGAKIG